MKVCEISREEAEELWPVNNNNFPRWEVINDAWLANLRIPKKKKWWRMFKKDQKIKELSDEIKELRMKLCELKTNLESCIEDVRILSVVTNQYEFAETYKLDNLVASGSEDHPKNNGYVLAGTRSRGNIEIWIKKEKTNEKR